MQRKGVTGGKEQDEETAAAQASTQSGPAQRESVEAPEVLRTAARTWGVQMIALLLRALHWAVPSLHVWAEVDAPRGPMRWACINCGKQSRELN